jgi:hypothetical protein
MGEYFALIFYKKRDSSGFAVGIDKGIDMTATSNMLFKILINITKDLSAFWRLIIFFGSLFNIKCYG